MGTLEVLLCVYAMAAIGLNFHDKCYQVCVFETEYPLDMTLQIIGRAHRCGNFKPDRIVLRILDQREIRLEGHG